MSCSSVDVAPKADSIDGSADVDLREVEDRQAGDGDAHPVGAPALRVRQRDRLRGRGLRHPVHPTPGCIVKRRTAGTRVDAGRRSGPRGIRTPDLLIANETRYQLRHGPERQRLYHPSRGGSDHASGRGSAGLRDVGGAPRRGRSKPGAASSTMPMRAYGLAGSRPFGRADAAAAAPAATDAAAGRGDRRHRRLELARRAGHLGLGSRALELRRRLDRRHRHRGDRAAREVQRLGQRLRRPAVVVGLGLLDDSMGSNGCATRARDRGRDRGRGTRTRASPTSMPERTTMPAAPPPRDEERRAERRRDEPRRRRSSETSRSSEQSPRRRRSARRRRAASGAVTGARHRASTAAATTRGRACARSRSAP